MISIDMMNESDIPISPIPVLNTALLYPEHRKEKYDETNSLGEKR